MAARTGARNRADRLGPRPEPDGVHAPGRRLRSNLESRHHSDQRFDRRPRGLTTAPAFGARFSVVGQSGLGVEATYFYAASKLELSTGPLSQSIDGHVEGGNLKLVFQPRATGSVGFALSGGVAGIKHAGDIFNALSDQFDIGGVLGGSLRIPLTPGVTGRIDGEGFFYSWSAGEPFSSASQTTLLLSAGLAIRL